MEIFDAEINDGLSESIKASAYISYASIAQPCSKKPSNVVIQPEFKSEAAINDSDLYYVQSILVSSSWNKNDDIFDKKEIWAARNTPEDKPTNLEHDENIIIGHITSNWPISEDGQLIDENTEPSELPDKYHILTGSVIYKAYSNPELKARAEKLIEEIENGQKFVSMECFFSNFDYGLIDKTTNSFKILERNNSTAYLTKYLRAYGGLGEHENYKIGRVLRNITFSGKGFVDRPANPDSIIFSKSILEDQKIKNTNFDLSGVSNIQFNSNAENNTMSLEKEVAELKEKIEAMSDCSQVTKDAYAAIVELKETVASLEKTIADKDTEITTVKASLDEAILSAEAAKKMAEEEVMKKEEEVKKAKSELESISEVLAAYKEKEADMVKKEKKMKRMASLIESGLDSELASATADQFENLDDESFDAMAKLLAAMKPAKKEVMVDDEQAMMMKKKASENTDTEILETVEVENDVNLGVASEEDSTQSTRAALVEYVCHRLGKNLNKGE